MRKKRAKAKKIYRALAEIPKVYMPLDEAKRTRATPPGSKRASAPASPGSRAREDQGRARLSSRGGSTGSGFPIRPGQLFRRGRRPPV